MRLKGHKHIKASGGHFSHKINIFVLFFCILAAASIISFSVFAGKGDGSNNNEGESSGNVIDDDDSKIIPCGGYVCYTTQNGDYSGLVWIYVPTSSATSYYGDAGAFANAAEGSANTVVPGEGSDNNIKGCDKAGGYYVLGIMRYYKQSGNMTGDVKGPFLLSQANSGGVYNKQAEAADGAYTWGDGSYSVTSATAAAAFAMAQEAGYETGKSWGAGNFSAFCAWKDPADTVEPPVVVYPPFNCADVKGILKGDQYGNTMADAYVKNYSSTSGQRAMIAGDGGIDQYGFMDNYVFAKPGDSIQFRHRLCSAAQQAQGNQDATSGSYSGRGTQSIYKTVTYGFDALTGKGGTRGYGAASFGAAHSYSDVEYHFYISSDNGEPYLFGNHVNNLKTKWITVNPSMTMTPLTNPTITANTRSSDRSAIGFQVYSPSEDAGSKYKCSPIYTINFGNTWVTPGYQAPGFISQPSMSGSCGAVEEGRSSNQVGTIINQAIHWNNIVGFVQTTGENSQSGECKNKSDDWSYSKPCASNSCAEASRTNTSVPTQLTGCNSTGCTGQDKSDPNIYNKFETAVAAGGKGWGWRCESCQPLTCRHDEGDCCAATYHQDGETTVCNSGGCVPTILYHYEDSHGVNIGHQSHYNGSAYREACCTNSTLTQDKNRYWFPITFYDKTKIEGHEEERDDAKVYIPYNFSTNRSIGIDQTEVVYGGSSVSSYWGYNIVPKTNPYTSTFDYATITPGSSKVQVVEFTLPADAESVKGGAISADIEDTPDVCSYFGFGPGSADCQLIQQDDGPFNATGDYSGASYSGSATRAVPDVEVGTKYCVAIGIYPADSLNWNSPTISNLKDMGMIGGNTWNISSPVCRTIAKKPSFQVWNGGIFTPSGIVTSVSKKMVGVELGNTYYASATSVFGSWDEYLIVANGSVRGMSSAAGLGYNGNDNQNHYGFALKGGSSSDATLSSVSALTISNANKDNSIGKSGISSITSTILTRLKARYKNIDTTNLNTGLEYWHLGNGATIGNISKGTVAPNADGSYPDNTLVIQVDGTVTITGNICYGACAGPSTKLSSYNLSSNNIAALPQILIFADNIQIAENVTRVDAWLIADQGTVDTCAGKSAPSAAECSETLVVNGPVFAQKLILNRTAGALPGGGTQEGDKVLEQDLSNDGSITPGEIFNLRADTYYWAYAQAQRYTEAVVTYMRELAPRF